MATNKVERPFKTPRVVFSPGWEGGAVLQMSVGLAQDTLQGPVTPGAAVTPA